MKFKILLSAGLMLSVSSSAIAEGVVAGRMPSNMAASQCSRYRDTDKPQVERRDSRENGGEKDSSRSSNTASAN